MTKPSLIIYGDCQASHFTYLVKGIEQLASIYDIQYLSIINEWDRDKIPYVPSLPVEVLSRCAIFWCQIGPDSWITPPDDFFAAIPIGAKKVTFPTVYFSAPWMLMSHDLIMYAQPPKHSVYPYQDRFLIEIANSDTDLADAYEKYNWLASANCRNFHRVLETDLQIMAQRDTKCSVPMTAFVFSNFKHKRLFWNRTNPSNAFFKELASRLIKATWPGESRLGGRFFGVGDTELSAPDVRHYERYPIMKPVAEALELSWWDPSYRYWLPFLQEPITISEYVNQYVQRRRELTRKIETPAVDAKAS